MFKAHRLVYHSTLGLRATKKKKDLALLQNASCDDLRQRYLTAIAVRDVPQVASSLLRSYLGSLLCYYLGSFLRSYPGLYAGPYDLLGANLALLQDASCDVPSSLGRAPSADYFQVDTLGSRYKFVNFRAERRESRGPCSSARRIL